MATQFTSQPTRRPTQQVFKPRATLVRFTQFFPLVLTGIAAVIAVGVVVGYYLHMWLIPVFLGFPMLSTGYGAVMANRASKSRVVLDPSALRVIQGEAVTVTVPWNQVTRLTVRQANGDNVYEIWIRNQSIPLQAGYYENGDQLLAQVSSRTNRPWERQRPPQKTGRR